MPSILCNLATCHFLGNRLTDKRFNLFNLATMSGVFPGTRTQVFQRVRLDPISPSPLKMQERGAGGEVITWAQILWYTDPPSCVVHRQVGSNERSEDAPLLGLADPQSDEVNQQLRAGLCALGWRLRTCGSCAHWRQSDSVSTDNLPVGRCVLQRQQTREETPDVLATQSCLALDCLHWLPAEEHTHSNIAKLPVAPLTKVAEISESKLKPRQRLQRRLRTWLTGVATPPEDWKRQLLERSGVGAGTEPCFACQGRIANLAALTVESADGDKQTFSVWRCRSCFSLYLSDWTDRWERLENLETEEIIYRLAPVEAAELLTLILSVPGGEHPALRRERANYRTWFRDYLAGRAPVSHQVKQGR